MPVDSDDLKDILLDTKIEIAKSVLSYSSTPRTKCLYKHVHIYCFMRNSMAKKVSKFTEKPIHDLRGENKEGTSVEASELKAELEQVSQGCYLHQRHLLMVL